MLCNASEHGFGTVGYLTYVAKDQHDQVMTTFLAYKTCVAPLKVLSIPRLELQGAVLAVRLGSLLQEEL